MRHMFVCECYLSFIFFFFFQAEDGIRDLTVTGVQTCALPISALADDANALTRRDVEVDLARCRPDALGSLEADAKTAHRQRSEERRVGKECRSRWAP